MSMLTMLFVCWLILSAPRTYSLGLTQSNLMDLYLLSRSVVGAEVNFDNSKDSGEGCAVNPSKSS